MSTLRASVHEWMSANGASSEQIIYCKSTMEAIAALCMSGLKINNVWLIKHKT